MVLDFVEPTDWWLEVAAERQAWHWQQSQAHPTAWGRWNAYLNQLCLETCLTWLQTERFPEARSGGNAADWAAIWEVVNGAVVRVGGVRVAIIPTEAIDQTELVVPQEWVDLPDWAADYYLAVQVTAQQSAIALYGYATHQQLKSDGTYDPDDRTYCLDQAELTTDLQALWFAVPHYAPTQTRAVLDPLPALSAAQAQQLVERLGHPTEVLPRLAVPFAMWGALLNHPDWRRQLYQQRQQQWQQQQQSGQATPSLRPLTTQLGDWFQGQFDQLWRAVDQVLLPTQWAIATRSAAAPRADEPMIYRAKGLHLGGGEMALVVGITQLTATEARINLQLHPAGGALHLPGATQMRLLTGAGGEIAQAQGIATETIQLQFRVNQGERFGIEITCNAETVTERFEL